MAEHPHILHSWKEARKQVTAILARLNRDPALLLAAMANPLRAMHEIGFDVTAEARQEFEDRIRFGGQLARRLGELREALRTGPFGASGLPFSPDAEAGLQKHLATIAGVPEDGEHDVDALLEQCRARYPHLELLIEYRAIQRSKPPFADAFVYERIRRNAAGPMPLTRVRARLHSNN